MKVTVIGGGPGGLYFSILLKKALPDSVINVHERNKSDDSFGFGVVFSDETLSEFLTRDPQSYELIRSRFAYWDDLDVVRNGETVRVTGNGFCGCSRKTLLNLLYQRCIAEGVNLHFESPVTDLSSFADSDVIVACDGLNSVIREKFSSAFGTKIKLQRNKFVWLGSTKPLDAFAYFFRTTPFGTFVAHSYQYEENMSTWIFECTPETWQKAGFETTDESSTISKLSEIYKDELDGHPLISNRSHWRQFPTVSNDSWSFENIVLLGDAKATAHYSIGSGTKLAMESAIALADSIIDNQNDIPSAFQQYDKKRRTRVEMTQHAAAVSLDWFENMERHIQHPFSQFAFGVMTRAKKVTYENLRLRDSRFTDQVLADFNSRTHTNSQTPAAFTPFKLRDLIIPNRIALAPMEQYSAENGVVNDWHLVHYGSRATGGCGLIITEAVAVSEEARITSGCAMIKSEKQVLAWKRVVDFIHKNSNANIAIQLGHGGRKASVGLPWNKDFIQDKKTRLLSASAIPFSEASATPIEITENEMSTVITQFVTAAQNAEKAGFDMIELQAHHGFLLASFLSPLTNTRTDSFGGSISNRLKFPLQVFRAIRDVFPQHKPISVRISASDWAEGGISEEDVIAVANAFKDAGADIINVSTAYTVSNEKPQTGRMWQTPFSDLVRNSVHIPTITAGGIHDIDMINTIILNGRADIVAVGRPLLLDSDFVRNAQAYEGFRTDDIPKPYYAAIPHQYGMQAALRKEKEAMKKALKPESHKK
ncbi:MAG TPA: FAD-dependent monooxygenase [Flavobacterium sp.]|jgi:anthraniloyl-CoA monooxygenase